METENEWDDGVPLVLFALHEARQESLGFSPSELVFGHNVRGPLKILKDKFFTVGSSEKCNVLDFISRTREHLRNACAVAKEELSLSQKKMKHHFNKRAVTQNFMPGEEVLVLLPSPGSALAARFAGPYCM